MIFCADCGSKLHFAVCKRFDSTQDIAAARNIREIPEAVPSILSAREPLKKIVLNQIFQIMAMMIDNGDEFFKFVARQR